MVSRKIIVQLLQCDCNLELTGKNGVPETHHHVHIHNALMFMFTFTGLDSTDKLGKIHREFFYAKKRKKKKKKIKKAKKKKK
jgi:hypothetical protein